MLQRLITAIAAALALLVAAPVAHAQDAPKNASPAVEEIYADFSDDGVINACRHKLEDLQKALDTIEPEFDQDYPDFRAAVEAGINDHFSDNCSDVGNEPTATPTPSGTSTPSATPESGSLPPENGGGGDSGGDSGGGVPPVEDGTLPPEDGGAVPEAAATPAPPAGEPAAPPVAAAATPTPSPTPVIVASSRTDRLLIPGIVLAGALLCALALGAFALAARRSPRFAHAWREASFRTRGTWADFSDWLRFGR